MTTVVAPVDAGPARVSSTRWLVLGAYALLAASTQLLWLTFAPIDTAVAHLMRTDAGSIGDLAAVFPLIYIALALPTGRWLDARFGQALGLGALLTGGGALLRLVAPTSFLWQLGGQVVIAAGQPLVLNSITKIAARNFPPAQRAMAISVGSVALFVGILAAVLAGGPLFDAGGLPLLLTAEAIPAAVAAGLMLLALRVPPAFPDNPSAVVSLRWLARDRFMWLLAALVFIGMGTYNAVATWLQPILEKFGHGGAAGRLIAVMTFAGIIGAAVLPPIVAARDRRRGMLLAALGVSAVAFFAISVRHDLPWLGAWLFVDGFVLMASLPIVLDWSEVHAGPGRQGAATGFLLMAGNLGGLVLVVAAQLVIGIPSAPLLMLAAVAVIGLVFALRLPAAVNPPATG